MRGDFCIGEWTVHPALNSLERDGRVVHLEPKIMQVLLALAAEPGEVVSRERVRNAVWPDVFVGEDVLIRAISEIRRAFSDDPRSPHTIQTVPKAGYRLIAPVAARMVIAGAGAPTELTESSLRQPPTAHPAARPAPSPEDLSQRASDRRARALLSALIPVGIAAAVLVAVRVPRRAAEPPEAYRSRPLTTYPGSELQPAFSPDGNFIAFVWRREDRHPAHIYVKQLSAEVPSRLTSDESAEELSPAWSPDGHRLAFVRRDQRHTGIVVVPATGGSEHEVYTLPVNFAWEYGGLSWTHDGEGLIFPRQSAMEGPSMLVELSLKDFTIRTLTTPPPRWDGDWTPEISPDGRRLAFVRGPEPSARDIYVMDLPSGTPRRLTGDGRLIVGLAWSADGRTLLFGSTRGGSLSLWRVPADGGPVAHAGAGGDDAYVPAIARQGNRLVYAHGNAVWSIREAALDGRTPRGSAEILSSSEQDASPHVAPSGDLLTFQSWRSGSQEIWTARLDGSNPVQLTSSAISAGSPSWSPDGRSLAYDARPDAYPHIYITSAAGGTPRAVTQGGFSDIVPSWSADGRYLYFGSNRSGSWQIWRTPADGSAAAVQVTAGGGMVGMESGDGRWLYFTRYAEPGIWRCPAAGGTERKIFGGPPVGSQNYWTLHGGEVYSLAGQAGEYRLVRTDPETGHTQTVHIMEHDPTAFAGVSITPDGRRILFAEMTRASSDLTLVEPFR